MICVHITGEGHGCGDHLRENQAQMCCAFISVKKKKGGKEHWGNRKQAVTLEPGLHGDGPAVPPAQLLQLCLFLYLVGFRTVSQICMRKSEVMGSVGTGTHLMPN